MRIHIAIVTTEFLRDFINDSIRRLNIDMEYDIYTYGRFEDIPELYRSMPDTVSGVITTGSFPTLIIERSFPETRRVIRTINNDDADLYKLLLMLTQTHPGLSLDRIYLDPVAPMGMTLHDYIMEDLETSFTERIAAYLAGKDLASIIEMEKLYCDTHCKLWNEGRIDISITRFSSIMYTLKAAGIPCYFAYPSLAYMGRICHETMQAVQLQQLSDNQIAVLMITAAKSADPVEQCRRQDLLHKTLVRFSSLTPYDLMPRITPHGVELLTNRRALTALTSDFRDCRLQADVKARLGFAINVGYGLGTNIYQARLNAVDANREAALYPAGASCLVNENGDLIGPLHSDAAMVVPRDVSPELRAIAQRSGLANHTVQRIAVAVSTAEEGRVTARSLAEKLSITTRSANRFLSALHEAGLAQIDEVMRSSKRGRPERVYSIKSGVLE